MEVTASPTLAALKSRGPVLWLNPGLGLADQILPMLAQSHGLGMAQRRLAGRPSTDASWSKPTTPCRWRVPSRPTAEYSRCWGTLSNWCWNADCCAGIPCHGTYVPRRQGMEEVPSAQARRRAISKRLALLPQRRTQGRGSVSGMGNWRSAFSALSEKLE